MKFKLSIITAIYLLSACVLFGQQRYLDEVFDSVTAIRDILYGVNVSVLTGEPTLDSLHLDIYQPEGDNQSERPVAIVLHTGSFLPKGFFAPTGDKNDYANVEIASRLAKRGYVAISMDYRLGWNPFSQEEIVRRATLTQALYRTIQDVHTAIRYLNMTIEEQGNPYGMDKERVALFGMGGGGVVALNTAVLGDATEVAIPKFSNPFTGIPFIDTLIIGDVYGVQQATENIPNHVEYCNDFHFTYSMDGGLGDTSWLYSGSKTPLVCAGIVNNPGMPFGIDRISGLILCELPIYPIGGGNYNVSFAGSACVISRANELGINDQLNEIVYDDAVSEHIRTSEYAQEHLWPIHLPGEQVGPWEYWDSVYWKTIQHPFGDNMHEIALRTNPDMSMQKANRYIDTALWFFAPRAYVALELAGDVSDPGCDNLVSIESPLSGMHNLNINPNPASTELNVSSDKEWLLSINMFDTFGRLAGTYEEINSPSITIDITHLPSGMYVLQVFVEGVGYTSSKVVIAR